LCKYHFSYLRWMLITISLTLPLFISKIHLSLTKLIFKIWGSHEFHLLEKMFLTLQYYLKCKNEKAKTYVKIKGVSNPHLLINPTTLTMNNVNEWCCPNSRTDLERGYPIYSHQSKQQQNLVSNWGRTIWLMQSMTFQH
jgi:hypothetical protein